MGRPTKHGIDYWPFDTNMFENKKLKLIKHMFGAEGMLCVVYLLNEVYKNEGYYKKWDEDDSMLLADSICCSVETIEQIIKACCEKELFCKEIYEKHSVLTSVDIQRRYLKITACGRDRILLIKEYWLEDIENNIEISEKARKKIIFISPDGKILDSVSPQETPKETQFPAGKPVGNATKQSKANKSKANESKANESKVNKSTAKQSKEEETEALICDEGCAVLDNVIDAFSAVKEPSQKDICELSQLLEQHGEAALVAAAAETARKGGRSVAYLRTVLGDITGMGKAQPNAAAQENSFRPYNSRSQPSQCYPATYDIGQYEREYYEELMQELYPDEDSSA